jgi:hypothetical protein
VRRALQAARSFTFHTLPHYAQRWCHVRNLRSTTPEPDPSSVRPEVSASLERSLRDHADVWAKLAKY